MRDPGFSPSVETKKSSLVTLCHNSPMGVSDERAVWLAEHVLPFEPGLRAWLARRRVVDLEVDDIVQETYAVLAELDSVAHIRNPRNYLYTVAHSIILRHVRHERVVSIEAMADIDRLGIYSEEPSPEEALSHFQELRNIGLSIAALPDRCREAFTLRRIHGLAQRDVARKMNISEGTVEKHIGRAIKLLMTAMKIERSHEPSARRSAEIVRTHATEDNP
jgi:RNA polymerase sigma factor (sigma-70 family)